LTSFAIITLQMTRKWKIIVPKDTYHTLNNENQQQ
jgi:hypothetical protein